MSMNTVAISIVLFLIIITVPVYLIINHQNHITEMNIGLNEFETSHSRTAKSNIQILSSTYTKYPNYNSTIEIKNTGSYLLYTNQSFLYIDGNKTGAETSKKIAIDIINPGLWDPGETLVMECEKRLNTNQTYTIEITSEYGIKDTYRFDPSIDLQIYRIQSNPIGIEVNESMMKVSIAVYNPNDETRHIWNITDTWNESWIISKDNALVGCSPACIEQEANNRILWDGNYSISSEDYIIFEYTININSSQTDYATAETKAFTKNSESIVRTFEDNYFREAAIGYFSISGGGYDESQAIGKIPGDTNTTFTVRVNETSNEYSFKKYQNILLRYSQRIIKINSTHGNVTVNSTHINYTIPADIAAGNSRTFTFWALLPNYHMPVTFNGTMTDSDGNGALRNDLIELVVTSEKK